MLTTAFGDEEIMSSWCCGCASWISYFGPHIGWPETAHSELWSRLAICRVSTRSDASLRLERDALWTLSMVSGKMARREGLCMPDVALPGTAGLESDVKML